MLSRTTLKSLRRLAATTPNHYTSILPRIGSKAFTTNQTESNEEESVVDLINQQTAAIEGQSSSVISSAFQNELNSLSTFTKMQEFFESNKAHMTLTQSLLLLIKMNTYDIQSVDQRAKAQHIQSELVSKCLANKAALSVDKTGTLLITLATSKFDTSIISKKDLMDLESHILLNMNELIQKSDPPSTIAAMIKLKHIPEQLIAEVNKMNQLTVFKDDSSLYLLRMLINNGITNQVELYQKLWEKIDQTAFKIHLKRCSLVIEVVNKYNQLMPAHQNENIKRMQNYIDKYAELIQVGGLQPHFALSTMNQVKEFNDQVSNSIADEQLDINKFYRECTKQLMSHADAFKPGQLLHLVLQFEDQPQHQKQLLKKTLEAMRKDKIDIRAYNFGQLASFISYVSIHHPKDLHVFAKYVDSAVAQGFFDDRDLDEKFRAFSNIMHTFALYDELSDGAASLKWVMMISDYVQRKKTSRIDAYLIDVIWTLVYRDTKLTETSRKQGKNQAEMNPVIPRLLESLYTYKRETSLTRGESLKLFQINQWIQQQLSAEKLPANFKDCIPEQLLASVEDRYSEYDKSVFPEVQTDIAKRLLDLRVTFRENQKLNKLYRADIKLEHENMAIMLHSEDPHHPAFEDQGRFPGHDALKTAWLKDEASETYDVRFISIESWKELSYLDKLKMLTKITQKQKKVNL